MKKKERKILLIFIQILIVILLATMTVVKYLSIDRSGKLIMDGIVFKGEEYRKFDFAFTKEGKIIGEADSWDIKEIPEDKEHNFLAVRSFLDNFYVVKESYIIPEDGQITGVYISNQRYTDQELIWAVTCLLNEEITEKFYIKTDNIYHFAKMVYVSYEDCPVGTKYIGLVGKINGQVVYIEPTEQERQENGAPKEQIYCCYIVPNEYKEAFEIFPYYIEDTIEVINENGEAFAGDGTI